MKKFFIFCFFIFSFMSLYAINDDINALFNLQGSGDIVYYNSDSVVDNNEYSQADSLKTKLERDGYKVYSIVIADVLDSSKGNEFIALISSIEGEKISVYGSNLDEKFSYQSSRIGKNAAIDLESFYDKKNEVGIIKYYILNDSREDRDIYLYIFRVEENKISLVADVYYYREINSMKSGVVNEMKFAFKDIDGDGISEMLVEYKERVVGRAEKIEYQIYKLSKNKYECVASSWLDDEYIDLSPYFKRD